VFLRGSEFIAPGRKPGSSSGRQWHISRSKIQSTHPREALVTSGLSRRSFFTVFHGWLGLSGYSSTSGIQHTSRLAFCLSSAGSVDLNSTAEQTIEIPHASDATPEAAKVVLVDVIQDHAAADTSLLRWAPGYPVYDVAASSDTIVRVLVRFAIPAGVPATGRARIMFEVPGEAARGRL
jgi:hypothetical protein